LTAEHLVRYLVAAVRSLGIEKLEDLDIVDGTEIVICAGRAFPPRIAPITEFYPKLFVKKEEYFSGSSLEARLKMQGGKQVFGSNIQSAEQYSMLAKMGLVEDRRTKKNGD
jgi:hypothetical protein